MKWHIYVFIHLLYKGEAQNENKNRTEQKIKKKKREFRRDYRPTDRHIQIYTLRTEIQLNMPHSFNIYRFCLTIATLILESIRKCMKFNNNITTNWISRRVSNHDQKRLRQFCNLLYVLSIKMGIYFSIMMLIEIACVFLPKPWYEIKFMSQG